MKSRKADIRRKCRPGAIDNYKSQLPYFFGVDWNMILVVYAIEDEIYDSQRATKVPSSL